MTTIYMGDQVVRISVVDEDSVAVDLSTYAAYGIIVTVDDNLVQKYMSPAVTGYDAITVVSPATGVFDFDLHREDLEAVQAGDVYGQVLVYSTDADFLASKKILIGAPVLIATNQKNENIASTTGY